MAKRIEQSYGQGQDDPRWIGPVLAVSESSLPADEPVDPAHIPPTLTLVGGTDVAPKPLDPLAPPQT